MPDKPHYSGHRKRLRERFLKAGGDAMPDYELLELVLFRTESGVRTQIAAFRYPTGDHPVGR